MQMKKVALAAAVGTLLATSAQAGTYVLQSGKWGAVQAASVARAGGTVKYSNEQAGIAVVESANPSFLAEALAAGGITSGAADQAAQWTEPIPVEDASVNPGDDTFYNTVQWAPQSIDAPGAWAAGYTGSGVRVAVIDGGIYAAHPDLAGAVDVAASRSFAAGAPNGCRELFNCDTGTFWHGTHVAGIIAARDNAIGVVGIAPNATIVGVKALHGGGGTFGAVISAILYAATEGRAHIINMSLGAEFGRHEEGAAELVSALNRAVNFATARGVLVVVSAGNSGLDFDKMRDGIVTPAESGNAIAISATGPIGYAKGATNFSSPASYSNYGNSLVWVAGPGGDAIYPGNENCTRILANGASLTRPCWVFDLVLSTSRAGYSWAAGTSMSAPAVSAVAALMKERNPSATPAQLKTGLARSATDEGKPGQDNFYGRGYVNARRAVTQ